MRALQKHLRRFLALTLVVAMCIGLTTAACADGYSKVQSTLSGTNEAAKDTDGRVTYREGGVSNTSTVVYFALLSVDTGAYYDASVGIDTVADTVQTGINNAILAQSGGAFDGGKTNIYAYNPNGESNDGSFKELTTVVGSVVNSARVLDFANAVLQKTEDLDSYEIDSYLSLLSCFSADWANQFNQYLVRGTTYIPVLTWNIGMWDNLTGFVAASTLASGTWGNGYSEFADFTAAAGAHCGVSWRTHIYCRIWMGDHHSSSKYVSNMAETNFATIDGLNYYARNYVVPLKVGRTEEFGEYKFTMMADPTAKAVEAGSIQTATWQLTLQAEKETLTKLEVAAGDGALHTIVVTIKESSLSNLSPSNWGGVTNTGVWPFSTGSELDDYLATGTRDESWTYTVTGNTFTATAVLGTDKLYAACTQGYSCPWFAWVYNNVNIPSDATDGVELKQFITASVEVDGIAATPFETDLGKNDTVDTSNNTLTTYASWIPGTDNSTCTQWTWSTTDLNAYAEIIGNCIGTKSGTSDGLAADWNVAQGIPSTENVSVAAGGQVFGIDLGGWIHAWGTQSSASNDNVGSASSGAAITRTITFDVTLEEWWGETNTACSLNCDGHDGSTVICGGTVEVKLSDSATGAGTSKCGTCGKTYGVTSSSFTNDAGETTYYNFQPSVKTCTASGYIKAYHDNTYELCGDSCIFTGAVSTPEDPNEYNQAYVGTMTAECKNGSSSEAELVGVSLIDEGYTTGYGCDCSHTHNAEHTEPYKDKTLSVVEYIDICVYRELTSAEIVGLTSASISEVSPDVINTSAGSSTNADMGVRIWRASSQPTSDKVDDTGRVVYTPFVDADYSSGWISTSFTPNYWVSTDVTIYITAYADYQYGVLTQFDLTDVEISYERTNDNYSTNHDTGIDVKGTTNFSKGDQMSMTECHIEAVHLVNAWQNANNKDSYQANVVSDMVTTESSYPSAMVQWCLVEMYGVGDKISLFDYAFDDTTETHYRTHKFSHASDASSAMYWLDSNVVWDTYDSYNSLQSATTLQSGYLGTIAGDPGSKYGYIGSYKDYSEVSILSTSGIPDQTNVQDCDFEGDVSSVPSCYSRQIGLSKCTSSGYTYIYTETMGSQSEQSFDGYYTTFKYPNMGSFYTLLYVNNSSNGTLCTTNNSGNLNASNSYSNGDGSTISYGVPMVISNIDLVDTAPNGQYASPIHVQANYTQLVNLSAQSTHNGDGVVGISSHDAPTYCKYTANSIDNTLNDIVIHDPVSVQYWQLIGNQYGSYDSYVTDDTGEDQRILYSNVDEVDKTNYTVIGNEFHLWVTDFGDFADSGNQIPSPASYTRGVGCSANGSSSTTGEANTSAKGYTDNLNTTTWTAYRLIKFSFPVTCTTANGELISVDADTWLDLASISHQDWAYGTDGSDKTYYNLQGFTDSDEEFKYGMDYTFIIPSSAMESVAAEVEFASVAINAGDENWDYSQGQSHNTNRESGSSSYQADNEVYKYAYMDIVGRIGNLALEDTGDFRFSNLFKVASKTWLIDGVIKEVTTKPNTILTAANDIMGPLKDELSKSHSSLSTLSMTNYTYRETDGTLTVDLGKAGNWEELPLTAYNNNVTELATQQLRMGYSSYFDIETIGNYYGISYDDNGDVVEGPENSDDAVSDDWIKTMTITPYYYLYDYEECKFYAIDLYAGTTSDYTRFYASLSGANAITMVESTLSIDLPNEATRRNVTEDETSITDLVLDEVWSGIIDNAAYMSSDYIGTAMQIVLDYNDLDYIGSNYMYGPYDPNDLYNQYGEVAFGDGTLTSTNTYFANSYYLSEVDFGIQSQRWYFTLSVPSSTIATYASVTARGSDNAYASNQKLKKEHPNSVIFCFADIQVEGTVWSLQYDAKSLNGGPITVTLFGKEKPSGWDDTWVEETHNMVTLTDNIYVYDENGSTVTDIDTSWAPLLVYDAYNTSALDWSTYGTH